MVRAILLSIFVFFSLCEGGGKTPWHHDPYGTSDQNQQTAQYSQTVPALDDSILFAPQDIHCFRTPQQGEGLNPNMMPGDDYSFEYAAQQPEYNGYGFGYAAQQLEGVNEDQIGIWIQWAERTLRTLRSLANYSSEQLKRVNKNSGLPWVEYNFWERKNQIEKVWGMLYGITQDKALSVGTTYKALMALGKSKCPWYDEANPKREPVGCGAFYFAVRWAPDNASKYNAYLEKAKAAEKHQYCDAAVNCVCRGRDGRESPFYSAKAMVVKGLIFARQEEYLKALGLFRKALETSADETIYEMIVAGLLDGCGMHVYQKYTTQHTNNRQSSDYEIIVKGLYDGFGVRVYPKHTNNRRLPAAVAWFMGIVQRDERFCFLKSNTQYAPQPTACPKVSSRPRPYD